MYANGLSPSLFVTRCRFRAETVKHFDVLEIDGCVYRKIAQERITGQTEKQMSVSFRTGMHVDHQ